MKVYIAGPISGLDSAKAVEAFHRAEERLLAAGHEPVNPYAVEPLCLTGCLDGEGAAHRWDCFMRACLPLLAGCHAIFLLPGWRDSRGALLEHHIAEALGMEVFEL